MWSPIWILQYAWLDYRYKMNSNNQCCLCVQFWSRKRHGTSWSSRSFVAARGGIAPCFILVCEVNFNTPPPFRIPCMCFCCSYELWCQLKLRTYSCYNNFHTTAAVSRLILCVFVAYGVPWKKGVFRWLLHMIFSLLKIRGRIMHHWGPMVVTRGWWVIDNNVVWIWCISWIVMCMHQIRRDNRWYAVKVKRKIYADVQSCVRT